MGEKFIKLVKGLGFLILFSFFVPFHYVSAEFYVIEAYDGIMHLVNESDYSTTSLGTIAGDIGTVYTVNGASVDTITGDVYIVVSYDGNNKVRYLATLDVNTLAVTTIGDLGEKFAGIAFDNSGNLYGLTGDGAATPASLFSIDKNTAAITLLASYDGSDWNGEGLTYNRDDELLYRASDDDIYAIDISDPTTLIDVMVDDGSLPGPEAFHHIGGTEFYYGDWRDLYLTDTNTQTTTFLTSFTEGVKTAFHYPIELSGLGVSKFLPLDNASEVSLDTNLRLLFTEDVFVGTGNLTLYKMSDDSVVETIAITDSSITGWGTNELIIDLPSDLEYFTEYYINIDATAVKDIDEVFYLGISDNTGWSFTTEKATVIVRDIPDCECYEIGSAESNQPADTSIFFSDNDGASWRYVPIDDGNGRDCNITNIKLVYNNFEQTVGEDLQAEFAGTFTDSESVDNSGGEIALEGYDLLRSYSHALGSDAYDQAWSVDINNNNEVFVTGWFGDDMQFDDKGQTDYIIQSGASDDAFLTKYNADGSYAWTQTVDDSQGYAVYADDFGDIYIGGNDVFAKYDSSGVLQWNYPISPFIHGIHGDSSGNVYVTGYAFETITLSKYSSDGVLDWTRTFGGRSMDIFVKDTGVYVTGHFINTVDFDAGAGSDLHTSNGGRDIFLTRYNTDGSYGWTRTFGGTQTDYGAGVEVDSQDNVYAVGAFSYEANFDDTGGSDVHGAIGEYNSFITRYNTDGSYDGTVSFYGPDREVISGDTYVGNGIAIDDSDNIYVSGYANWYDRILIKSFDSNMTERWTRIAGDPYSYWTEGYAIDVGTNDSLYVVGFFDDDIDGFNADATGGTDMFYAVNNDDILILRYNTDGSYPYENLGVRYPQRGIYQTSITSQGTLAEWGEFVSSHDAPANTEVTYEIMDSACAETLIAPVSDTIIDLSSIDSSHSELCLKVRLDTDDDTVTPFMNSWNMSYFVESDNLDPTFNFSTQTNQDCSTSFVGQDIIKEISECECYKIGSAEAEQPAYTQLSFSNDDGATWDYAPTDDGDGKDCNVTNIKLVYDDEGRATEEDFVSEFDGDLQSTVITPDGNGTISLLQNDVGTLVFGGEESDYAYSVAVDWDDNIYVTGNFRDTVNFDDTGGTDEHTSNGVSDAFVTKYNSDNTYAWTRTFGGSDGEVPLEIQVDSSQNIFVLGYFTGTVDFDFSAGEDTRISMSGGTEGSFFITKHNSDGSYGWTRVFDKTTFSWLTASAVDSEGNIYMGGRFYDSIDFDDIGEDIHTTAYSPTYGSSPDGFVVKYNADGSYGWTRTIGATSYDTLDGISFDGDDNMYIVGEFRFTVDFDFTAGINNHTTNGWSNVYLSKHNANGTYGWTRSFGRTYNIESARDVAVNDDGVYLTGLFYGTNIDFDGTVGIDYHSSADGRSDIYLTKYNLDGSYGWTHTIVGEAGSNSDDYPVSVDFDSEGSIYIGGGFQGTADFDDSAGTDIHGPGGGDYITKFTDEGLYEWTNTFGQGMFDFGDLAIDSSDNIFLVGDFGSAVDFDGTGNIDVHVTNGGADGHLTQYKENGAYGFFQSVYPGSGTYESIVSSYGDLLRWDSFTATHELPDVTTDITYEILDEYCEEVLVSETSDINIDISTIDTSYEALCLRAYLQTSDKQISPYLDKWAITYFVDPKNTNSLIRYTTKEHPDCSIDEPPVIPPEDPEIDDCKTTNIKNITEDSVDLRVEVDRSYDDKQQFKVKVEKLDTGDKETVKIKETPSDNGMVTLTVDNLEQNTNYKFKAYHEVDDEYEYCSSSKEAKTLQKIIGPVIIPQPELPVCGTNKREFEANETEFDGTFCSQGTTVGVPEFPAQGEAVFWTCASNIEEVECYASRESAQGRGSGGGDGDDEDGGGESDEDSDQQDTVQAASVLSGDSKDDEGGQSIQEIVTYTLVPTTVALTAAMLTVIPLAPLPLQTSVFTLFAIPFIKRRKEKFWGVVFDSETKQPQKNAVITLIDTKSNEKIDSMVTDETGRYGFLISNQANYKIEVKKGRYKTNTANSSDLVYGKLYAGPREFTPDVPIELNIALSQHKVDWQKYVQSIAARALFKKLVNAFLTAVFVVGAAYSIYATYTTPMVINFVVLVIYGVTTILLIKKARKHYGTITKNDKPLPFTLIELYQGDERKHFTVTDIQGRYYLLAQNGDYSVKVKGQPAGGEIFEKHGDITINKGILREDVRI